MRIQITTNSPEGFECRTIVIDCDEVVTGVRVTQGVPTVVTESGEDLTPTKNPMGVTAEEQPAQSLTQIRERLARLRGDALSSVTDGKDQYKRVRNLSFQNFLAHHQSEIPFVKGLITREILRKILTTKPVQVGLCKRYYWDEAKSCGFDYEPPSDDFYTVMHRTIPPREPRWTWFRNDLSGLSSDQEERSSDRIMAYMKLERMLSARKHKIPFVRGLAVGYICDRVMNTTPEPLMGTIEAYYWNDRRTCGFTYDAESGEWGVMTNN